jgi:hypothetical protein
LATVVGAVSMLGIGFDALANGSPGWRMVGIAAIVSSGLIVVGVPWMSWQRTTTKRR